MERVVNIIGMGASAAMVPDTGENWGINFAFKTNRLDKLFFMEDLMSWLPQQDERYPPVDYTFDKFLEQYPNVELISKSDDIVKNVKTGEKMADIRAYPLYEVCHLAPGGYFSSTVAYIIAYAILQKEKPVNRLRLYGMEAWSGGDANEYNYQRPCMEFWLAFAMGRGIKVEIPYYMIHTNNCNQNFYGYFAFEAKHKNYKINPQTAVI